MLLQQVTALASKQGAVAASLIAAVGGSGCMRLRTKFGLRARPNGSRYDLCASLIQQILP